MDFGLLDFRLDIFHIFRLPSKVIMKGQTITIHIPELGRSGNLFKIELVLGLKFVSVHKPVIVIQVCGSVALSFIRNLLFTF